MNLVLLVYLASVVDDFAKFFGSIGFLGFSVYFLLFAGLNLFGDDYESEKDLRIKKNFNKYWKLAAVVFPLMMFISAALPSERTIYLMAGAYAAEQIASNERVQKIGSDVLSVIEAELEKLKEGK